MPVKDHRRGLSHLKTRRYKTTMRFSHHVFVCQHSRPEGDKRGCCASKGSEALLDYAKGRIAELGLRRKIRINRAGCLDACQYGPSVVIYPDDIWYRAETPEDFEEIIECHLRKGEVVERLQIFRKEPGDEGTPGPPK